MYRIKIITNDMFIEASGVNNGLNKLGYILKKYIDRFHIS